MKTATYYIQGMHCPSCEILIKEEMKDFPGVTSVKANAESGEVTVEYTEEKPSLEAINKIITEYSYCAFNTKEERNSALKSDTPDSNWPITILIAAVITVLFFVVEGYVNANVHATGGQSVVSSFMLGLVASISSCAALVGGLLLSQAKNWEGRKYIPYIQFNSARVIGFIAFGGLLGMFGSVLNLSLEANFALVTGASVLMIILGVQMLDVIPGFKNIKLQMPEFMSSKVTSGKTKGGFLGPILLGAGTFFLPCSFTLAAQLQAISSGSFSNGATIMGAFALGTLPLLLAISFTSENMSLNKKYSKIFLQVAGLLVIMFAFYTINNQLNVMGLASLSDYIN